MRGSRRLALAATLSLVGPIGVGATPAIGRDADVPAPLSAADGTVEQMAAWVLAAGDNGGLPFVIVDKVSAKVFVYHAQGELRGSSPALIGQAPGDHSAPGIGDRRLSEILPEERTTAAGRFVSGFGKAGGGRSVLWIDYATALALHPVVTTNPKERRFQRLRTPSAADNRITYGCINVAASFFDDVVRPTFGSARGIVYIMPDTKPVSEVFPTFSLQIARAATAPTGPAEVDE